MSAPKIRVTVISHEEFTEYEFIPPATFYFKNAMGDYIFLHTSNREVAQGWIDNEMGSGRYTVVASKIQKGKPLGEGSRPAYGTASRKK